MSNSSFVPKVIKVVVFDRETKDPVDFEIQEFVLSKRIKVVNTITDIYKSSVKNALVEGKILSNNDVAASLISAAGERIVEIYKLVLDKDDEWLGKNMTLKDEINVVKAILEVNDIPLLMGEIQNLLKKPKS